MYIRFENLDPGSRKLKTKTYEKPIPSSIPDFIFRSITR